jgi:deoxyribodipyrimidine photo-lyase
VFWNEIAQAPHQAVADQVAAALIEIGVSFQSVPGDLLAAPANIRNKDGRGLRVFTPFWRRGAGIGRCAKTAAGTEGAMSRTAHWRLHHRKLAPRTDASGPGRRLARDVETGGVAGLRRGSKFLQADAAGYSTERDRPDRNGTSRLSPHLRFGEVSPRQA